MPDGAYHLGRHAIQKTGETVRLADGTLAGSVLTMERAFANFASLGLDEAETAKRTSSLAADYLGLADEELSAEEDDAPRAQRGDADDAEGRKRASRVRRAPRQGRSA